MEQYLPMALGLAMLATLIVLVIGIVSFAVSGKFYVKNANLLMRARVVMQAIALAIFGLATWLAVNG